MDFIRILLAEDHTLVREGISHTLAQYPDMVIVGQAEDGEQAIELIERLHPEVAVLDIRMPKLNGIEVLRRMKIVSPRTRALMLTAYDDDDYVLAAMELGAAGYLLKTAPTSRLIESVRAVSRDEMVVDTAIATKIAHLWAQRHGAAGERAFERLSPRELEVLELAAEGCRNRVIAEKLCISVRTVEGHFNHIFLKLSVSSRTEAVLCGISRRFIRSETKERQ